MSVQMTILGLGQVGASLGLALGKYKSEIQRTGHDREMLLAQKAQKAGALDRTNVNLPRSVENADIVVLALPLDELRDTLETISPALKDGAVLLDLSTNKAGVAAWVVELLPPERYYVTMTPSFNPEVLTELGDSTEARADLFKNGLMAITSPGKTHADALKLASDISLLIGAKPYFSDQYELDGLSAAADQLPKLAAAALLHAAGDQPGWREAQKMAGRAFTTATIPVNLLDEEEELGLSSRLNAENTLRALDRLIAELQRVRASLAANDSEGLTLYLKQAREIRSKWWDLRQTGTWDKTEEPLKMPTAGEVFGRLFGLGGRRRGKR